MIALDPEFIGSLAPPSKLTTTDDGKPTSNIPFARLPRFDRLRVQGKADETEVAGDDDGEDDADGDNGKKESREEREKRKMRGKGKSLKRFDIFLFLPFIHRRDVADNIHLTDT